MEGTKGHPTAGLALGICGIAAAIGLCPVAGVVGCAGALALGVLGIVFGAMSLSSGAGRGALVTGIVACALALTLTAGTWVLLSKLRHKAQAQGAPKVAEALRTPFLGAAGIAVNALADGADARELSLEFIDVVLPAAEADG